MCAKCGCHILVIQQVWSCLLIMHDCTNSSSDSILNKLGHTWKENALTVTRDLASRFVGQGVTADMADRHLKELLDPSHSFTTDMYFTWSRKRTDT